LRASDASRGEVPVIEVRDVSKSFGAVRALKGVNLAVYAGEIHGLIGANGAGKSTLIQALAGAISADSGEILIEGKPEVIRDPVHAGKLGLAFLHQELNLVPHFTAVENMGLGVTRRRFGLADTAEVRGRARRLADALGIEFDLERPVSDLSVAQQWLVALGRALMRDARAVALDEPSASLSAREAEALFRIVRQLAEDRLAILYVSHRLEEIEQLCDRVTVFRDGEVVDELDVESLNRDRMVRSITGRAPETLTARRKRAAQDGEIVLEARHLSRGRSVRDVSLHVRKGEILGLAGLVGSGRSEVARLLFAADQRDGGEILLTGQPLRARTPADAEACGIALVPEERRSQALFMGKSASFNVNLAFAKGQRISTWIPLTSVRKATSRAMRIATDVDLRPLRVDLPARQYSGGNQQKLALMRWLIGDVRVLILDEPTRGIDVGARRQIHNLMHRLADDGMALIVISSEFEELLECGCDRVVVMANGSVVDELSGTTITVERMMEGAYAVSAHEGG
jgi:ABC-type sugar transport system ATPase subunit